VSSTAGLRGLPPRATRGPGLDRAGGADGIDMTARPPREARASMEGCIMGYDLSRWSPANGRGLLFPDFGQLHQQFERIFDDAFAGPAPTGPRLSVHETTGAYVVTMDAPGVALADLDVSWSFDEGLTIRGERKAPTLGEGERAHLDEQRYGAFARTVRLPTPVRADAIEAGLEHGVLRVRLPKTEEARPRKIEVRAAPAPQAPEAPEAPPSA
jgi:HSP20 family protein